jgi:GNAT superfamily N-acetyltransferase
MDVRVAGRADLQAVTTVLADAFADDPVWSWAFPEPDRLAVWWRFWVGAAIPQGGVRVAAALEAAAVWIPPGGQECFPEDEAHVEPLTRALAGDRADAVLETLERFEVNHPRDEPHHYLSLLGTASTHRGRGLGMMLLEENLQRIDDEHAAAYLESSNPANLARYERVGFAPRGEFILPDGDVTVTTMWRPARA